MKDEYDFSQARKNPYARSLKQSINIRLDQDVITYFKDLARETDIPYQRLINLYLKDCARNHRKLSLTWNEHPES